jgi:hypothetical protein
VQQIANYTTEEAIERWNRRADDEKIEEEYKHTPKIGHFDICKVMARRGMDIRMSLLDNVKLLRKVKAGTDITIGFEGNVIAEIAEGKTVGGLLLCNADQYFAVKAELEKLPTESEPVKNSV